MTLNLDSDGNILPYGSGTDKIFGMENFGNTCYCNSVLQSLYYTRIFREKLISFPEDTTDRKRKVQVKGSRPHSFLIKYEEQQKALEKQEKEKAAAANGSKKSSRRSSIFTLKENKEDKDKKEKETKDKDSDDRNDPTIKVEKANLPYPGLKGLKLGYKTTNHNVTIVGATDDPFSSTDMRKKTALLSGPIINLDSSLSDQYKLSNNMFSSLKDIFESMVENDSQIGVVSPLNLINTLKKENELFRNSMHQDAHEFLNFLMNNVIETIDTVNNDGGKNNWCNEIFQGLIINETKCLSCENISSRDEPFLDLSIDLEKNNSITKSLDNFSKNEILTHQNKFYCDKCNSLQEATKKMRLKKLPKILSLHLKRFKYNESLQKNVKLFNHISYPLQLRLSNTVDEADKLYELYAVVVHIGGGPSHGHYISLIKTENSGWLLFDDETVESIDEYYVLKFFGDGPGLASAYVLFYQECETVKEFDLDNLEDLEGQFEERKDSVGSGASDRKGSAGSNNERKNSTFSAFAKTSNSVPSGDRKNSIISTNERQNSLTVSSLSNNSIREEDEPQREKSSRSPSSSVPLSGSTAVGSGANTPVTATTPEKKPVSRGKKKDKDMESIEEKKKSRFGLFKRK